MNGDDADVVDQGGGRRFFLSPDWRPHWRPPRSALVLLAVGLVIGLAVGYGAGYRQTPRQIEPQPVSLGSVPPPPAPTSITVTGAPVQGSGVIFSTGPGLTQTVGSCAALSGGKLQLGVQVTNESTVPVRLGQVHTVLPLGGLRVISQQWEPCGAISALIPDTLGPGDSIWLSVTVRVLIKCPGPLPVLFTVGVSWPGGRAVVQLPGFPDLSHVPYPGCAEGGG